MKINHSVTTKIQDTFRVNQLKSIFDLSIQDKLTHQWEIDFPYDEIDDWKIGLILGPSGSGKTTLAKHIFKTNVISGYGWPKDKTIIDGFPEGQKTSDIVHILNSVGFSSPPSWLKPFRVLSNGEKFRATLARAIIENQEKLFVIDEFTSVVDRTVAKIGSHAVSKSVRKSNGQMIAVSCHYDIADWLEPDWILDLKTRKFRKVRLRRPKIKIEIYRSSRNIWEVFKHHHYLSGHIHRSARCYVGLIQNDPVVFCAVLPSEGHKGRRRIHRLVVLPDYQGVGVGKAMMNLIGTYYQNEGLKLSITSSHPSVINGLKVSPLWKCRQYDKTGSRKQSNNPTKKYGRPMTALATFDFIGSS